MRMVAVFEKSERLRHIGHLDILRAMQRALRRAGLPVAYSNGFNPHILLYFASALQVGAVGCNELMEVTLRETVTPEAFLAAMNRALPPEMQLKRCFEAEAGRPALMAQVLAQQVDIHLLCEQPQRLIGQVNALLSRGSIPSVRKSKKGDKEVDIRPLIYQLSAEADVLHATLALTEHDSCKPDMLVRALAEQAGQDVPRVLVVRQHLLGRSEAGELVPLEQL